MEIAKIKTFEYLPTYFQNNAERNLKNLCWANYRKKAYKKNLSLNVEVCTKSVQKSTSLRIGARNVGYRNSTETSERGSSLHLFCFFQIIFSLIMYLHRPK